jgi:uncharacterized repeat protein (TIGR03803 family)
MRSVWWNACASGSLVIGLSLLPVPAAAANYQLIYNFGSVAGDGIEPVAELVADKSGVLYGTTSESGACQRCAGTLFSLAKSSGKWTETTLPGLQGTDGVEPGTGLLIGSAGELYGTTSLGGTKGYGTVFRLSGGAFDVLHSFVSDRKNGAGPHAGLVFGTDGLLYGTASYIGQLEEGAGAVFSISPSGDQAEYATVHKFGKPGDGYQPWLGRLATDTKGDFFGTTFVGGAYGFGAVYSLAPKSGGGWRENVVYSFNANAGDFAKPNQGVIRGKDGVLYGCAPQGAHGQGGIYQLTPPAKGSTTWTETVLYSFGRQANDPTAANGCGLVMDSAGNIFGTADQGGAFGDGAFFELTPSGQSWTETILHSFNHATGDGQWPLSAPLRIGGTYYGVTEFGGSAGVGTAYAIKP